jgi:HEAT repeat protein
MIVVAAFSVLVGGAAAAAQAPASTLQGTAPASLVAKAREALAAGRLDEAAKVADVILAKSPADRDATDIKIQTLVAARKTDLALRAYEAYAASAKTEDASLLAPVARGDLQALGDATQTEPMLRTEALERLVRYGANQAARRELEQMVAATVGATFYADVSLARLGDVKAAIRLAELAGSESVVNKVPVIEALRAAGAKKHASVLVPLLDDPNPLVRAAAAQTLGAMEYREALSQLREGLDDPIPYVRLSAAAAVRQLGDAAADARIDSMLKSESPDVRLMAVEALAVGKSRGWVSVTKPLLADPNGLTRLRAAELLATDEPAAARAVLARAVTDPNPVVRQDAVRILETLRPYDVKLLRGLLRDQSSWVRLYAAGSLLAAAKPDARK